MRVNLLTIALAISLVSPASGDEVAVPAGWLTDHAKAAALAKKARRPLLVEFTGSDW